MGNLDRFDEIMDKLGLFMQSKIDAPIHQDKIQYSLLFDELFVRMMMEFSEEIRLGINRQSEVRNVVLSSINDFKPDGIVMHRYMATFLHNGAEQPPDILSMQDGYHVECRLFGIRTALFGNYDEFPYNKVLMIRQGEPNPVSRLLSFNTI